MNVSQVDNVALVAAQKDFLFRNRFQNGRKLLAERNDAAIGEGGVNLMETVFKMGNAVQGKIYRNPVYHNGEAGIRLGKLLEADPVHGFLKILPPHRL